MLPVFNCVLYKAPLIRVRVRFHFVKDLRIDSIVRYNLIVISR